MFISWLIRQIVPQFLTVPYELPGIDECSWTPLYFGMLFVSFYENFVWCSYSGCRESGRAQESMIEHMHKEVAELLFYLCVHAKKFGCRIVSMCATLISTRSAVILHYSSFLLSVQWTFLSFCTQKSHTKLSISLLQHLNQENP